MEEFKLSKFQKVCHFIVFEGSKEAIPSSFYKEWGMHEKAKMTLDKDTITQFQFYSTLNFFPKEEITKLQDNVNQYAYDVIIIEFPLFNVTAIGFPVRFFAVEMTNSLVNFHQLQLKRNFVSVNLISLIQFIEKSEIFLYDDDIYSLGGVFLLLTSDNFLSTVRLIGKNPLESEIYIDYFKEKLISKNQKGIGIEKIILKSKNETIDKSRGTSSMHIDKYGNFKFFIQRQGNNILSVIKIFHMLNDKDCFISRPHKPLIKKEEDE